MYTFSVPKVYKTYLNWQNEPKTILIMKQSSSILQRICVCSLLLFGINSINAQDILWEKSYGGKQAEYLFDAIATPDYGFILAGSSVSKKSGNKTEDSRGDLDYWVWKMDEKGELDWQKNLGGIGQDLLSSIVLTNDGGFLLAGSSNSNKGFDKKDNSYGNADFWIIKLNVISFLPYNSSFFI